MATKHKFSFKLKEPKGANHRKKRRGEEMGEEDLEYLASILIEIYLYNRDKEAGR